MRFCFYRMPLRWSPLSPYTRCTINFSGPFVYWSNIVATTSGAQVCSYTVGRSEYVLVQMLEDNPTAASTVPSALDVMEYHGCVAPTDVSSFQDEPESVDVHMFPPETQAASFEPSADMVIPETPPPAPGTLSCVQVAPVSDDTHNPCDVAAAILVPSELHATWYPPTTDASSVHVTPESVETQVPEPLNTTAASVLPSELEQIPVQMREGFPPGSTMVQEAPESDEIAIAPGLCTQASLTPSELDAHANQSPEGPVTELQDAPLSSDRYSSLG